MTRRAPHLAALVLLLLLTDIATATHVVGLDEPSGSDAATVTALFGQIGQTGSFVAAANGLAPDTKYTMTAGTYAVAVQSQCFSGTPSSLGVRVINGTSPTVRLEFRRTPANSTTWVDVRDAAFIAGSGVNYHAWNGTNGLWTFHVWWTVTATMTDTYVAVFTGGCTSGQQRLYFNNEASNCAGTVGLSQVQKYSSSTGLCILTLASAFPAPAPSTVSNLSDCDTVHLNWTDPAGNSTAYIINRTSPLGLNTSWNIPPYGNFTLRLFNDTIPLANTTFSYTVASINGTWIGPTSDPTNITPSPVMTFGDCGLQWGGMSEQAIADAARLNTDGLELFLSIIVVLLGTSIGFAFIGGGAGAGVGAFAGILVSLSFGYLPEWAVFFLAALMAGGLMLGGIITNTTRDLRGRLR